MQPAVHTETSDDLVLGTDVTVPRGERWDRVIGVGSAVIAGLSTLLMQSSQASATHGCLSQPDCCSLATCIWCPYTVSPDRFYCNTGTRYTWSCVDAGTGQLAWCGECAGGADCWSGPFSCSAWFWN